MRPSTSTSTSTSILSLFALITAFSSAVGAKPDGAPETKDFTTSDGTGYVYDFVPAQGDNSTVLFVHGWPSTRHDWASQIAAASAAGYGVIAPDMLGYGDSDRPIELESYRLKRITGHIAEIIGAEHLQTVIGVGHDWGSSIVSRALYWHRELFEKAAFLSVGYDAAGHRLAVDALNRASLEKNGYMNYGYWYFFNSHDAHEIMEARLESAFSLIFPANQSAWGENFADLDAARSWLTDNTTTPLPDYLTEEDKQHWIEAYSKKNSFATSLSYYKALLRGIQWQDEADVSDEDKLLHVPVLGVAGLKDLVTRPETVELQIEPYARAGYEIKELNTGHWMTFEDPEGLNTILLDFFAKEA